MALALGGAGLASGGEPAVDAARRAADQALTRHDPVRAEAIVRAAIAQTHADDALRAWLAQALLAEGDRAAADHVANGGNFTPDSAGAGWRVRGQIALAAGNLGGAAQAFDHALLASPGDADLWVSIAAMRFTGGEQALAIAAADHAVALDPANPRALALRGLLIREQYGLAAALPWFEAALQRHRDDPALLDAYGSTLGDMGQYHAMLVVARKLAEVDPKSPRPRLMEAVLAARAGDTALARRILERTGTALQTVPAAMLLSGVLDYQAGNHAAAVEVLERLVALQPDNVVARRCLARALAAKGDWRRLVDLFDGDAVAGRVPGDTVQLVARGWIALAAREAGDLARHDRDHGNALAKAAGAVPDDAPALRPASGTLAVLAEHAADTPHAAGAVVPYIRALLAAHQADTAQGLADRLRDENAGNAEAHLLAGDVRMVRHDLSGALADYTNAAAIRFNEAVLVRMDAALRANHRGGDADAMTSRYLAQNPQSGAAMLLLAAGWADNPARAHDLDHLRKAMLARGLIMPQTPSTSGGQAG